MCWNWPQGRIYYIKLPLSTTREVSPLVNSDGSSRMSLASLLYSFIKWNGTPERMDFTVFLHSCPSKTTILGEIISKGLIISLPDVGCHPGS
jgi:hypothetical protein